MRREPGDITYDNDADAMYICISDGPIARTEMVHESVNIDYVDTGVIGGIEILSPKFYVINATAVRVVKEHESGLRYLADK